MIHLRSKLSLAWLWIARGVVEADVHDESCRRGRIHAVAVSDLGCERGREHVQGSGDLVQGVRAIGPCCRCPATAEPWRARRWDAGEGVLASVVAYVPKPLAQQKQGQV